MRVHPLEPRELRIVFFASRDMAAGEQLFYDYGDKRQEVVAVVALQVGLSVRLPVHR